MRGSRRESAEWAKPSSGGSAVVDVLIPTIGRGPELATTLAGLAAQDDPPFRVVVSDQSAAGVLDDCAAVHQMVRLLRAQGREVVVDRHLPRRGLAEQRQHLLGAAQAPFVLFLDDDVWLEPGCVARMAEALETLGCGFVGCAVQGLSYLDEERPEQREAFEMWGDSVQPERIDPGSPALARVALHSAANLTHLARTVSLPPRGWVAYKVAWVGACVLFRRTALEECGGFDFWRDLPAEHSGEDVAAQWRVMERYGGAGILPSGAVHLEAPTTVVNRDVDAAAHLWGAAARSHDSAGPSDRR